MTSGPITLHELYFLVKHDIAIDEVASVGGLTAAAWKSLEGIERFPFVLRSKGCRNYGHRLYTRSGHCIQCNTARIAYMRRSSSPGFVYIASSESTGLVEVGFSSGQSRVTELNRAEYAGASDWVEEATIEHAEAGRLEREVHKRLALFRAHLLYIKEGRQQFAGEVYSCSLGEVELALLEALEDD